MTAQLGGVEERIARAVWERRHKPAHYGTWDDLPLSDKHHWILLAQDFMDAIGEALEA